MLVAAPESKWGAAAPERARVMLGFSSCFWSVAARAESCRASLGQTGSEARSHITLVGLCSAGLMWESRNKDCWSGFGGGTYSVAGVSSSELAKWEPMPVIFSAVETIH